MGNWSQIAAIPANRNQAAAVWHDDKVYLLGGLDINSSTSISYTNTLFVYDPVGNTWTTGALLPATGLAYAFSEPGVGVHLVFPETGAHYVYDPALNTWAADTTAPIVARRDAHHFVDAAGRFYLAGGRPSSGTSNVVAVHRYDPATGLWTALTNLPAAIAARLPTVAPGVLGSDGKVYLGYGSRVNPGISVYDPATDTWATAPSMPDATNAVAVSLSRLPSGIVLALPHQSWAGSTAPLLNRVDGYDPATGLWTMGVIPNYPGVSWDSSVATEPGGLVYLLGGLVRSGTSDVTTAAAWAYKQNEPPTPATLLTLTGGVLVSTAAKNRARHQFNDPNAGDSQSKFDWRHRIVGEPTWTTGTEITPNPWYDIAAGALDPGDYERQVLPYDAAGEAATAWTPSGFFTAAAPPAGPAILYPINGQILDQVEYVEWSIPSQEAYRVRRVADDGAGNPDEATIYFDTGEVVDTLTRRIALSFETNSRTEHVQVQIKDGGLWSAWDSVSGDVSYTPPPTPVFTAYPDATTGSLLLMITNPEPVGDDPAAAYVDVYVDDGAGEERKVTEWPTNTAWRYWTPVSGRDYVGSIRVVAVAANGTTASSA